MPEEALIVDAVLLIALIGAVVLCIRLARELRKLRVALQLRADQVAALSHEIRTPLAIIIGSSGILADPDAGLAPRHRRFAESIASNANRVGTLAETLLSQARLEAGLFTIHRERIELHTFLRNAVVELRQVTGRDIAIDTPGPPLYIELDPALMRQVLDNVVLNASRHDTEHGELTVSARLTDEDVVISVHDRGRGIEEHNRRMMFQRYATTAEKGTGLGLYVSRKIVQLHGGRILVYSLTGGGASFLILLPQETPE